MELSSRTVIMRHFISKEKVGQCDYAYIWTFFFSNDFLKWQTGGQTDFRKKRADLI